MSHSAAATLDAAAVAAPSSAAILTVDSPILGVKCPSLVGHPAGEVGQLTF